jgi:hypothetical protein
VWASEVSARNQREVDRGAGSAAEGRGSPVEANHTDRAGRSVTGRAGERAREEARTAVSERVERGEEGGGGARAENEFVRTNSPSTTAIVVDGFSSTTPSITSNEKRGHRRGAAGAIRSFVRLGFGFDSLRVRPSSRIVARPLRRSLGATPDAPRTHDRSTDARRCISIRSTRMRSETPSALDTRQSTRGGGDAEVPILVRGVVSTLIRGGSHYALDLGAHPRRAHCGSARAQGSSASRALTTRGDEWSAPARSARAAPLTIENSYRDRVNRRRSSERWEVRAS